MSVRRRLAKAAMLGGVVAGALWAPLAPAENRPARITALLSRDAAPYREVLDGFQQQLAQRGVAATYEVNVLQGDGKKAAEAMQKAAREGHALVLTLGAIATEAASEANPVVPVVASLILNGEALQRAANATGVIIEWSPDAQLDWLQRLLPRHKAVGVLFNPKENLARVEQIVKSARARGLTVVARAVESPQDLSDALDSVARQADVILGIPDSVVLSQHTAKAILLTSFRNRIPFIGVSSFWVKAGALYSLEWDYEDIGLQAGEQAVRILHGARARSIPPSLPRKLSYSLNLNTARQMGVVFTEAQVRGARQVFDQE